MVTVVNKRKGLCWKWQWGGLVKIGVFLSIAHESKGIIESWPIYFNSV